MRRRPELPGVELWSVRNSARLWSVYHTAYAFCSAHRAPGRQAWRYRGRRYGMSAGLSVSTIEPGEMHVTTLVEAAADFHVLVVDPMYVRCELEGDGVSFRSRHFATGQIDDVALYLRSHLAWQSIESSAADPLERQQLVRAFLLNAFARAGEQPPRLHVAGSTRAAQRARDFLEESYSEQLTLDRVATEVRLSKFHLERSFKATYGLPLYRYLKRVRIGRALDLLRTGRRPGEVATAVGLADQPHLSRLLREEVGLTPGQVASGSGRLPVAKRARARL